MVDISILLDEDLIADINSVVVPDCGTSHTSPANTGC